ncbi:type II toxin-antitoxin system RelE/ParE family toxin [Haemophilus haemoglobinophilus]|nr:type II toxin-antitoxin system RelE/ParE family toxin [Canicola haemoglobinophilus]
MRIFKTKLFAQFSNEKGIQDDELRQAIERANQGLIDANLGGNLIKQRIPRLNSGKSSGYRSIILYKVNQNVFFLYGFAKNQQQNISPKELQQLKMLGKLFARYTEADLTKMVNQGYLTEINGVQNV